MADLALIYKGWKSWVGQRVYVKKSFSGTLKYFGEIQFEDGLWCGVELDDPVGDNDGMIKNIRYFKCRTNYGIFVSLCETVKLRSTSSEVTVSNLKNLEGARCGQRSTSIAELRSFSQNKNSAKLEMSSEINKINPSQKSIDLNKTFHRNELKHIKDAFCFKVPKEKLYTDYVVDKKCKSVSKRSKNTCGRLETEESLGIISDLLDEDESWNLLDPSTANGICDKYSIQKSSDEIDIDYVFYPPQESSRLDGEPNICTEQVDIPIQISSNSKFTSTPKRCFSNVFDLNRTVKLNGKQSCDLLLDEPIVAGSSKLNFETDFDFENFKQSDILCSTLKCSLLSLPIQNTVSNEVSCVSHNEILKSKKKCNDQKVKKPGEEKCTITTVSNVCVNTKQFPNIPEEYVAENSDNLNTTFVINSDSLPSHVSTSLVSESDRFHLDENCNGVIQMNSTFETHDNLSEKIPEGENTFIIDSSPIKIPKALPLGCETVFKKTLSTILEKTYTENADVNNAAEIEDEANNITEKERLISSKLSSEDMDQVMKNSVRIASSDLNSTFCISSNECKIKKSTALIDIKKQYSLSSISVKNSVYIKKEKSVITSLKANGQKSTQSRLSVFTKKKSLQSSTESTSSLKQFKDIKSGDKNTTGIFPASKFLEIMPHRKLKKTCSNIVESTSDNTNTRELKKTNSAFVESNSDIANSREQLKESLGSCKNMHNLGVKKENESPSTLKVKSNSKVTEICKSISNLPTKIIPKLPLDPKKIYSESKASCEFKSKNTTDLKPDVLKHRYSMLPTDLVNSEYSKNSIDGKSSNVNHRHSMMPTVLRNSTRRKNSVSKNGSDVKCLKNAVKPSFGFTEGKSVLPSKMCRGAFGYKRGIESEHMETKSVPVEKVLENNPNIKCAKKNENSTILKSKLIKPGTLSRMPVPDKLSRKPGCILNTVDTQSLHSVKGVNNTDNQRNFKRLPLQKLPYKI